MESQENMMAKVKHWTQHRLTDPMLKAMSSMHNRQPHRFGTMLQALEARSPDDPLIRERKPKCPECGDPAFMVVTMTSDYPKLGDKLTCSGGHTNPRKKWGGCYGFSNELTETGLQALAAARKEGW